MKENHSQTLRFDHRIIMDLIKPGSRVLDLGCGDGELLKTLIDQKTCSGVGIEINEKSIYQCIEKGLTVSHADINDELSHYADQKFDYVILNESLQQVLDAEKTIEEALRVGKNVIVGVPNFCFWKARLQIFFRGRVPKTKCLPYEWYNTPNVRFFSLKDFRIFCRKKRIKIEREVALGLTKCVPFLPNMFASAGIFLLQR
jgi:methionine biosynthesis protein MetW